MINLWKYPFIYVLLLVLTVGVFTLLDVYTETRVTLILPDWLRPIIIAPFLIALLSTNLPDFLPRKVILRLKWLHSRPGINQFYYFITFQILVIGTTLLLKSIFPKSYLIFLFDFMASILGVLTFAIYLFLMLRILMNNPAR